MLDETKFDLENIWKIVKETRASYISENADLDCPYPNPNTFLSGLNIKKIINIFAGKIGLNTTSVPKENISYKTLQTSAEMFTYLNYCPSLIPKLSLFYAYLFNSGTPKEIILGLTSTIKTAQNSDEKNRTIEIFSKVMKFFGLNQYEKIQKITKGKCYTNATFGNCGHKLDINSNISMKLLGCFLCWYKFNFNI